MQDGGNLYFDARREGRENYYCDYEPPISKNRFAELHVTFPNDATREQVTTLCEFELDHWINKYGVPVMLTAWDSDKNIIQLSSPYQGQHLVGWLDKVNSKIIKSGNHNDLDLFLRNDNSPTDRPRIYSDFNYRTQKQVNDNAEASIHHVKIFKSLITVWIAAIPAIWAILQYFGPNWLAIIVTVYAVVGATREGLKIWGHIRPNQREQDKANEELAMKHHHYHCAQNPEGFLKLKSENFVREIKLNVQQEVKQFGIKTDINK